MLFRSLLMKLRQTLIIGSFSIVTLLIAAGVLTQSSKPAFAIIETPHFETISKKTQSLLAQYGAGQVLLVLDLDNVLMVMDEDLGSEQWFDWQAEKIKSKDPVDRVAETFDLLVALNIPLLNRQTMHATEKEFPGMVQSFEKQGGDAMVLTSRSPETQEGTLRELHRNGYDFDQNSIEKNWKGERKFLPEFVDAPKEVEFHAGVFFTSGQNKGGMLRALLKKAQQIYRAIVFADNKEKYGKQMHEAFAKESVDLTVYRYTHEDAAMEDFKKKDKRPVVEAWERFKKTLP